MPKMLNFGCADVQPKAWVNLDKVDFGQRYVADVLEGLPFKDDHFDCAVANHVLHMFSWQDLTDSALPELRRVLRPGGVLRVIDMDPIKAFRAYEAGDDAAWPVPEEWERTLDGKFCQYLTWYGTRKNICTSNYLRELLTRAGFHHVIIQSPSSTMYESTDITELDNRPAESYIVEARKLG
jgi:ubiquinone/menaquinone biosynthesis C-methylase UbiE